MKKFLAITLIFSVLISCKSAGTEKTENFEKNEYQVVIQDDYELFKPTKSIVSVLVLFGGYPEKAEDIKREINIFDTAKENGFLKY